MTTIIKLTNRIFWKNGDSTVTIKDNLAITEYANKKIANFVHEGFEKTGKKHEFVDGNIIVEYYEKMKEKDIVELIKEQLDSAIKNSILGQKISYVVEKDKEVNQDEKRVPARK